ncbi:MAG TPA: hypothetical protein VKY24_25840 [Reyranella sp.]|nr:hypothetical protein [Reyranella sp.]
MIDWLYALPEIAIVALGAAILAAIIAWLPRLVGRIPGLAHADANTEFVIRMQAPLFTMTALVLTFTLVEAERNFRQVDSDLTAEASQLNQIDRLLTRYDAPAATVLRPLVRAYAQSIVTDEWPRMLAGKPSQPTNLAYSELSRAIMALDPVPGRQSLIFGELLKSLDAAAESRDRRLANVRVRLPAIYWVVILFGALMLLFVSSTIGPTRLRTAVLGAQLAVLGAFIGFTFIMDAPFVGESAVQPVALSKAIQSMEARAK